MPHTPLFSTHLAPGRRRIFSLIVAALAALALLPAAAAQADTSNTLTIVGTSDVNDSGLIPNLIGPAFKEAYPQFAFKGWSCDWTKGGIVKGEPVKIT